MENNILNKEMVAELMELLECKRYYAECLKGVVDLKAKIEYKATSIEMRFYYFNRGGIGTNGGVEFHGNFSDAKLEVVNILSRHILSDMEADLEMQIKRVESDLWDKFRYTEDYGAGTSIE